MFDDLDDDDVTDLVPDKEDLDEEERQLQQARRGRRMTVSEVRIIFEFYLGIIKVQHFAL